MTKTPMSGACTLTSPRLVAPAVNVCATAPRSSRAPNVTPGGKTSGAASSTWAISRRAPSADFGSPSRISAMTSPSTGRSPWATASITRRRRGATRGGGMGVK